MSSLSPWRVINSSNTCWCGSHTTLSTLISFNPHHNHYLFTHREMKLRKSNFTNCIQSNSWRGDEATPTHCVILETTFNFCIILSLKTPLTTMLRSDSQASCIYFQSHRRKQSHFFSVTSALTNLLLKKFLLLINRDGLCPLTHFLSS